MALVRAFRGVAPRIAENAFVAENATIIGDVEIGPRVSVWYGAVLRGDVGFIRIGSASNVQDLACIHMTLGLSNAEIGEEVTIGHGAIVHGARVGDGALVGMRAVLLDGAVIGDECIVGAGALVPPRFVAPPRTLLLGTPAKIVRELGADEWGQGREGAARYLELAQSHRA